MKNFKVGIIGYGGFGKFLHHSWKELEHVIISAIADENSQQTKELNPSICYSRWQDLLDKDLDLIAIATLPNTHAEIAITCMNAGNNVLIEKPLATTLEDAQKIIRVRDNTQCVAGIDFMFRFNPLLQTIRQFHQQSMFGQLRRVNVENYAQDETLPPSHWFWQNKQSGGILIEHGVHFIDLVHFISPSKAIEVNGLRHNRNLQQEDQIMANVRYENGLIASHYHSFARPGFFETTKIVLAFDLADIELSGWIPLQAEIRVLANREVKQQLLGHQLFELTEVRPIDLATDESRPEGWGTSNNDDHSTINTIRSGGIEYDVNEIITGSLSTHQSKQKEYANAVRASLNDVLKKIENPSHTLAAPLETGLDSLEVAVRATRSARSKSTISRAI